MRRKTFWIAASCILVGVGLLPLFSSGTTPASTEKVIYSFQGGADGANPASDLVADADGNLYGTTESGGTGCNGSGCGTVFELKRTGSGWNHDVLYTFAGGVDGENPQAGLVFDSSGNLYGTTTLAGSYSWGNVFELSPSARGWKKTIIYSFTGNSDGGFPKADLVFDAQGNLYGTAYGGSGTQQCNVVSSDGCGAVFELMPRTDGSWIESTIHSFRGTPDGASPASAVVLDSSGNLYGVTEFGGSGMCYNERNDGCGTAYELTPEQGGTWKETILYNFVRGIGRGKYPSGSPFLDPDGHLYGLTRVGGDGYGTVFDLHSSQKGGWQQDDVHLFYGDPDGQAPVGQLVANQQGDLFGVSSTGGMSGKNFLGGTVLKLERLKEGWRETVIYAFRNSGDGAAPQAGLLLDAQGHLYGTTELGGNGTNCAYGNCGTVYEVTP